MKIKLSCKELPVEQIKLEDCENMESLIMMVCDRMDVSDQCSFYISGFGDKRWPVDIYTDLSVFLEQIPNALSSLHDVKEFEIDFYEQGIERLLSFTPILTDEWLINCSSHTDWLPSPSSEKIKTKDLIKILVDVSTVFLEYTKRLIPKDSFYFMNEINEWEDLVKTKGAKHD